MSHITADYNNYASSSGSCAYAALGAYNAEYSMNGPSFQGRLSSGAYVVPTYSPISYDSLTATVPSCSGYSNIMSAYGADSGSCQTTYRTSLCGAASQMASAQAAMNMKQ